MAILILLVLAGAVLGTAALTPWIFALCAQWYDPMPWPFSRVFDRVFVLVIVLLLVVSRKRFGLTEVKLAFSRFTGKDRWQQVIFGMLLTVAVSAVALTCCVQAGLVGWSDRSAGYYLSQLPGTLATAIVVSLLEESFFRVLLLGQLRRTMLALFAVPLAAVIYAAAHFFAPDKSFVVTALDPLAGFRYLGLVFGNLGDPSLLSPMLGLWIVGIVLGVVYLRTNSVYLTIGLHAGWILAAKAAVFSTQTINQAESLHILARRYFLVGHPIGWISVLVVGLLVIIAAKKSNSQTATKASAQ